MLQLDPNIRALMNDEVVWERFVSADVHGDYTYAVGKTKKCWIEGHGLMGGGVVRLETRDEIVQDALLDIYFDATDPEVAGFDMRDRFTVGAVEDDRSYQSQPDRLYVYRGAQGEPWVMQVAL